MIDWTHTQARIDTFTRENEYIGSEIARMERSMKCGMAWGRKMKKKKFINQFSKLLHTRSTLTTHIEPHIYTAPHHITHRQMFDDWTKGGILCESCYPVIVSLFSVYIIVPYFLVCHPIPSTLSSLMAYTFSFVCLFVRRWIWTPNTGNWTDIWNVRTKKMIYKVFVL